VKIQLASDLHFEFLNQLKYQELLDEFTGEADVLILAGDVVPLRFVDVVRDVLGGFCEKYEHVVYVPGNHEYYKTNTRDAHLVLGAVTNELHNLHWLNNNSVQIRGRKFFGGTLWFKNLPGNGIFKEQLNDFYLIKNFEPWVYDQVKEFEYRYDHEVNKETIVVSHHLPANESIAPKYKLPDPTAPSLNRFFLNDQEDRARQKKPLLWVHGHTHEACDYHIGETRVVCNPRGYPNEGQSRARYNSNLIIDVPNV
jgi:Icc-related predicted phosphoesterase